MVCAPAARAEAGLPYTAPRDAVLTHPAMLEGLIPLFSGVPPRLPRQNEILFLAIRVEALAHGGLPNSRG
jgi:hypothetical protein